MSDDETKDGFASIGDGFEKEIHRDDVDMEVAEALERYMATEFPGKKMVFEGDVPEDKRPQDSLWQMKKEMLHYKQTLSTNYGYCFDCGEEMKGFPKASEYDSEDGWNESVEPFVAEKQKEGWNVAVAPNHRVMCFECPKCVEKHDKHRIHLDNGDTVNAININDAVMGWNWVEAYIKELGGDVTEETQADIEEFFEELRKADRRVRDEED